VSLKKILGYVNFHREFPSPVRICYASDGRAWVRKEDGTDVRLNHTTEEAVGYFQSSAHNIIEQGNLHFDTESRHIGFAFSRDNVVICSREELCARLMKYIDSGTTNLCEKMVAREYLYDMQNFFPPGARE
jgi:hypothetical protein